MKLMKIVVVIICMALDDGEIASAIGQANANKFIPQTEAVSIVQVGDNELEGQEG